MKTKAREPKHRNALTLATQALANAGELDTLAAAAALLVVERALELGGADAEAVLLAMRDAGNRAIETATLPPLVDGNVYGFERARRARDFYRRMVQR